MLSWRVLDGLIDWLVAKRTVGFFCDYPGTNFATAMTVTVELDIHNLHAQFHWLDALLEPVKSKTRRVCSLGQSLLAEAAPVI